MRIRLLVTAILAVGCSTGGATDAGADGAIDVATNDVGVDAPNDGGSEADAAVLVPVALDQANKLALWLEATPSELTLGDGGGVATWKDKSKNKNDATGFGPLPVVESGVQAGHDAVHFNQAMAALKIADAASLQFGTGQVYVVAVTRVRVLRMFWFDKVSLNDAGSIATGIEFFDANGGQTDAGGPTFSPYGELDNNAGNAVTWGTPELNDGKFHIVAFRRTAATSIEVAVDDIAPRSQTVAAINVSAPAQPVYLGSPPQAPGPSTPDLAIVEELVVHDSTGVVSDADVASLHGYLKQKYGL